MPCWITKLTGFMLLMGPALSTISVSEETLRAITTELSETVLKPNSVVQINCTLHVPPRSVLKMLLIQWGGHNIVRADKTTLELSVPETYQKEVSITNNRTQSRNWFTADVIIPSCLSLKEQDLFSFNCVIIYKPDPDESAVENVADPKKFIVQDIPKPQVYYEETCLTCNLTDGDTSQPFKLGVNDSTLFTCRQIQSTDHATLTWNSPYQATTDGLVTDENKKACTFNHSLTGTPATKLPYNSDVYCSVKAASSNVTFDSSTVHLQYGDAPSTNSPVSDGNGNTGMIVGLIIGLIVAALVVTAIVILVSQKLQNNAEARTIAAADQVIKPEEVPLKKTTNNSSV